MKKILMCTLIAFFSIFILLAEGGSNNRLQDIEKVKMANTDIPEGFIYGKVPGFAKNVLKNNPWMLDQTAIKKLTNRIYPGGSYHRILNIHMTIIANKNNPYGDDIVCYIIQYTDRQSAKKEIEKISEYVGYNRDRAIVLSKNNLVVYLHVDDINNYHYIDTMSSNFKSKLEGI